MSGSPSIGKRDLNVLLRKRARKSSKNLAKVSTVIPVYY